MPSYNDDNYHNLKEYVFEWFFRLFDLTEERNVKLNQILDSFNASLIGVKEFKEHFELNSFFEVLNFILDDKKVIELREYGQTFAMEDKGVSLVKNSRSL